jgi:hypothetical protein
MYLLYLDESGTPDIPANTSHFVLFGLAIPILCWKNWDRQVSSVKSKYHISGKEIHTGYMVRGYSEQDQIADFSTLTMHSRRMQVEEKRKELLKQALKHKTHRQVKEKMRNFRMTEPYIHLTLDERKQCVKEIVTLVTNWTDCRLFAQVIDKKEFQTKHPSSDIFEDSFTQIVSRFEAFLVNRGPSVGRELAGLIVEDNNASVSRKLTEKMREFHRKGTVWTQVEHIVETPLFVDSFLTSMIQVADVLAYITRRYYENNEDELFSLIYKKFDKAGPKIVGIRHYPPPSGCRCLVCKELARAS